MRLSSACNPERVHKLRQFRSAWSRGTPRLWCPVAQAATAGAPYDLAAPEDLPLSFWFLRLSPLSRQQVRGHCRVHPSTYSNCALPPLVYARTYALQVILTSFSASSFPLRHRIQPSAVALEDSSDESPRTWWSVPFQAFLASSCRSCLAPRQARQSPNGSGDNLFFVHSWYQFFF